MSEAKKIGFIGCGLMGHGIAKNLIKGGNMLTIFNHPGNQPVDDLVSQGAVLRDNIAEIVSGVEFVFICVTGSPELRSVVFGDQGVLAGLQPGTVIIDATTGEPSSTLEVSEALHQAGGFYMDAPMTRTPKEAEEGRLNVMVGGEQAIIDKAQPLISCYAENMFVSGPVSSGQRMKLLHNFISLGTAVLLSEAYATAGKAGVDRNVLTEVLASGGGDSVVLKRLIPYIEKGDSSGFLFSLSNARKDMKYYTHMAEELNVGAYCAESIHQTLITAANVAGEQRPMPELIDVLAGIHGAPLCKQD